MNPNRWNGPFVGLVHFITHPRMWGPALLAVLISASLTLYVFWKVVEWTAPDSTQDWFSYLWLTLQMLGWGSLSVLLMILFVWPLILNYFFLRIFQGELKREGRGVKTEGFLSSLFSSIGVFYRTLRWRVIWPFVLILTILFIPILTMPLSILAINHLSILESVDVSLTALGKNGAERSRWILENGTDCMCLAISGSALNLILSMTLVGWFLWVPALFCGTFIYLKKVDSSNISI